jgi:radical SAM protein with 4Fe4S-binding SPASM domain
MTPVEFAKVLDKLSGKCKFIYLHLLGEPLLHPRLDELLSLAAERDFSVCITTNGTLLDQKGDILLKHCDTVHKVSISLHAPEGNGGEGVKERLSSYLDSVIAFARGCAERGIFAVLRLWNLDSSEGLGKNSENSAIEAALRAEFTEPWQKRPKGYRLVRNIFLEYDGLFTWPAESRAEKRECGFCHGLSQQIGILADGSVVPCCLDSDGDIVLGNIFDEELSEILCTERAVRMREGFSRGVLSEELCQSCTYSKRFGDRK